MNKKLKAIIAGAIACSVTSTYLSSNVILAYGKEKSTNNVDISEAISIKNDVKESLSEAVSSKAENELKKMYKAEDDVTVIVELESKPLLDYYIEQNNSENISTYIMTKSGKNITREIQNEQKEIASKISESISKEVKIEAEYKVALNGFAITAKFKDLEKIREVEGVKNAFISTIHQLPTNPEVEKEPKMINSNGTIGATEANESGYTGENTVVAVLDTGLDINHEAFQTIPESVKCSEDDISEIVSNNEMNANGTVYKSGKIPFAYDYADRDDNPQDAGDHGTHVAGTVASNGEKVKGVAPDAQLIIMKVFSSNGGGASDKTILAALDDAVTLGVDAINMSLGSAAGFTEEADEVLNDTYDRVKGAGINLICAAGNDNSSTNMSSKGNLPLVENPDNGIVGSPSTYDAATSIASVNNSKTYLSYFLHGDSKVKYSDTNAGTNVAFTSLDGEHEVMAVPGVGTIADFESVDVEGKIALVQRGLIAFTEKEENAALYGAKGIIVYNNVEGDLINMQTNGTIPAIFVSKADGDSIANSENGIIAVDKSFEDSFEESTSGLMSEFSSWGVTPDLKLKPEITAPGGGIYSTLPGDSYGSMNGTSMASPHVAGAAAVVREYLNENKSDLDKDEEEKLITNLLMSTASIVLDEKGNPYSPRKQGSGIINVNDAIRSSGYLTVDSEKPKVEMGDSEEGEFSFEFEVHNTSDKEVSYDLVPSVLTEEVVELNGEEFFAQKSRVLNEEEVNIEFDDIEGNKITLSPGESKTIEVSINLTEEVKENLDNCENGTFIDGFITLEGEEEESIDLSLPFLGFYGDWNAAPVLDSHIFDDEQAVMYDTAIGNFDLMSGSGYYLGMNMFTPDDEAPIISEDKIAIGNITGQWVVSPLVGLLRSAEEIEYSVTNSEDEVVYEREYGNQGKTYFYETGGFMTYAMDEHGWDAVDWDAMNPMPDGEYTYNIEVTGVGADESEELEFPITIDTEESQLVRKENLNIDGKDYLKLVVKDNHYTQAVQLLDYNEEPLTDIIPLDADEKGYEHELLFDLENLKETTAAKIVVVDYALNTHVSEEFGLTEDGILPESISLNSKEISIRVGGDFQMYATILPESAENKAITWTSSNPEVASIDENGYIMALSEGEVIITGTTFNGKSDSTRLWVNPPIATDLVEPYVITENGHYRIPEGLSNETITISEGVTEVRINGYYTQTKENPYSGLNIVSEGNTNLTLYNVNIDRTGASNKIVDFKGEENTLTLKGENNLTSSANYSAEAIIGVDEGQTLTIEGKGSLNANPGSGNYGAAIGGSASSSVNGNSGKIVINDGNINVTSAGGAAAIGGAGSGIATDIRINGGIVNATINDVSGFSHGTAIGSGGTAYNYEGKQGIIKISGGEVNASTNGGGAAIGECAKGNTPYNIIISEGIVNAESISTDEFKAGAAIGGGNSSRGNIKISILGGNINARTSSSGSAIGGGADNRAGSVSIEGGTVTASSEGKGAAIGNGYYGENQEVRLFKGSVKANATLEGVDAIGNGENGKNAKVIGKDGSTPYLSVIPKGENISSVMVNGEDWRINSGHEEDENLYIYLTNSEEKYIVEASNNEDVTSYSVEVKDGNVTVEEVDLVPPMAPSLNEENGVITLVASDEDTSKIEYSLDNEAWSEYSEPINVDEKQTIYARALDESGNVSDVVSYTVPDRTAPKAPIVNDESGVITLSKADEDTDRIEYSLDNEEWIEYTEAVALEELETIHVRAIDEAGNISGVLSYTVPDRTAPNPPVLDIENGTVYLSPGSEEEVRLEYSLDNETWLEYTGEDEIVILENETIYARSVDNAGNISTVISYTMPDETAPSSPIISDENGVVTILKADDDTHKLEYSLDNENWTEYTEPISVEEEKTLYARAIDKAGNVSDVSSYKVPDRTAPNAPKFSEEDGLVILTSSDEDTSVLEYSLDGEEWKEYTEGLELDENTKVYGRALDENGNVSETVTYTVSDKTAPDKPVIKEEDGKVTIDSDEDNVKIEYSFDNITWILYEGELDVKDKKVIYARVIDEAGNISEVSKYELKDKPEPPVDPEKPEPPVDPEDPTDPEKPNPSLPNTGNPIGSGTLLVIGIMTSLAGTVVYKRKKN